jgi:hypothetical protein
MVSLLAIVGEATVLTCGEIVSLLLNAVLFIELLLIFTVDDG